MRALTAARAAWFASAGLGCAGSIAHAQSAPAAPAVAPPSAYETMAAKSDPTDFVTRADSHLTLQGDPLRVGGVNITWLGLRQDGTAPPRRPTNFEVQDALATAAAMGAGVIRVPGLASTAGCALCLEPAPGQMNGEVFAQIDLVLATARDLGIKVIIPLADTGSACSEPNTGVICAGAPSGSGPASFFTDPARRSAFLARVKTILTHVNALDGIAYADDPTILAWEDCDACGTGSDLQAVSGWVEQLGQSIKASDHRHLYEDGAFAGRIGPGAAHPVPPALITMPSVDIVGDTLPVHGDVDTMRIKLANTMDAITRAGHVYMLDGFGWTQSVWKTQADFEGWLNGMVRNRDLAGALTGSLESHADQGGYLPPQPATAPGQGALYFPGRATADTDLPVMRERGRALRRFNYAIGDVRQTPAYLLPPRPQILSVKHGRVAWRGAAGAATYSIERSPDPSAFGSWTQICDACATDDPGAWQDPDHPAGQVWYRVMPLNINGHHSVPSEAVSTGG